MAIAHHLGMGNPYDHLNSSIPDRRGEYKFTLNDIPTFNKEKLIDGIASIADNIGSGGNARKLEDILNGFKDNNSLGLFSEALTGIVDQKRYDITMPIMVTNFPNDTITRTLVTQIALANNPDGIVSLYENKNGSILSIVDKYKRSELIFFDPQTNNIDVKLSSNKEEAKIYDANYGLRSVVSKLIGYRLSAFGHRLSVLTLENVLSAVEKAKEIQTEYDRQNAKYGDSTVLCEEIERDLSGQKTSC